MFNVVSDALQAHDDIDVIYCINDTSALGAVQAVEDAGKQVKLIFLEKMERLLKACSQRWNYGSDICTKTYLYGISWSKKKQ